MDLLTREEMRALLEEESGPCVSAFLPTHRAGTETQQDRIRLKNLLRDAEERLEETGMRGADARELLNPARALLDDELFWQHQSDGLALFLAPDSFRRYRVPFEFDELVVVTDRFHIKPLISLLSRDGRFYLLALSKNQVRLLQGTRDSVSEIEVEELPAGMDEALGYDNIERHRQLHTGREGKRGQQAAMFHGHGDVGMDDEGANLLRYFRQIDGAVRKIVSGEQAPLVLAAVDYLHPIYRAANSYPNLIEAGVEGNPDRLNAQELHDRAWEVVRPVFARAQQDAADRYRELAGTGRASHDLREIVPASYHGRVDSLFVALGVQLWGRYDAGADRAELHDEGEPGDQDLLDLAAAQTLLHGGDVFPVEPAEVPDSDTDGPVAAVFRY